MKVFAGFIRKYYQSLFSFISKNISPRFGASAQVELYEGGGLAVNPIYSGQNYEKIEENVLF